MASRREPPRARSGSFGGRREHGMATVWAVGWMAVCLTVAWVALVLAAAAARQHQVDGAADLVSLSAAARLQRGGDACAAAASVAGANRVVLDECQVDGTDVRVAVRAPLDLPFGIHRWVRGEARAGPV